MQIRIKKCSISLWNLGHRQSWCHPCCWRLWPWASICQTTDWRSLRRNTARRWKREKGWRQNSKSCKSKWEPSLFLTILLSRLRGCSSSTTSVSAPESVLGQRQPQGHSCTTGWILDISVAAAGTFPGPPVPRFHGDASQEARDVPVGISRRDTHQILPADELNQSGAQSEWSLPTGWAAEVHQPRWAIHSWTLAIYASNAVLTLCSPT